MCCFVTHVVHGACTRQVVVSNMVDSNDSPHRARGYEEDEEEDDEDDCDDEDEEESGGHVL